MHDFTPVPALLGGLLIGLAAALFLVTHGRTAGISGLFAGMLGRSGDRSTNVAFVGGLAIAGLLARLFVPSAVSTAWAPSTLAAIAAGVLVGYGTQLGGGCTSGHGLCGMSRLSPRSIVATVVFMVVGMITVAAHRLAWGTP